jgi:hypothetical protein
LADIIFLGDTAEQQIAAKATATYLESREGNTAEARTEARKEAVSAFLAALEADQGDRQN